MGAHRVAEHTHLVGRRSPTSKGRAERRRAWRHASQNTFKSIISNLFRSLCVLRMRAVGKQVLCVSNRIHSVACDLRLKSFIGASLSVHAGGRLTTPIFSRHFKSFSLTAETSPRLG